MVTVLLGQRRSTERMRDVERRFGRSLRDILIAKLNEHNTVLGAAKEIGVSRQTIYEWATFCGVNIQYANKRRAS